MKTSKEQSDKPKDNGFVEFGLWGDSEKKMVCFSKQRFAPDAVEIKRWEDFPKEWAPGRGWTELDIIPEAYMETSGGGWSFNKTKNDRPNLERLYRFIRAFGFEPEDSLFMQVWTYESVPVSIK